MKHTMEALALLAEAMAVGPSQAIENQEKRGQEALVASMELPIKGSDNPVFAVWGITFGDKVDELFCRATLPEGWSRRSTSHPMWTELCDEQGRARASIFYKAAFYDRDAFIRPNSRYRVGGFAYGALDRGQGNLQVQRREQDGWVNIHTVSGPVTLYDVDAEKYRVERDALENQAYAWLSERVPAKPKQDGETYDEAEARRAADLLAEWNTDIDGTV